MSKSNCMVNQYANYTVTVAGEVINVSTDGIQFLFDIFLTFFILQGNGILTLGEVITLFFKYSYNFNFLLEHC